mmetsp:Transcript_28961/g.77895  ORF Transcript_28961/g.77895 Transcript_28961/m.77895 type:complete len:484 (-) Transcript_28961:587-2038(-)
MALVDGRHSPVESRGQALGSLEHTAAAAQAHGSAHVRLGDLGHVHDHRVFRLIVKLRRVRILPAQDRARILDDGDLEAQADAKVRHLVLARELGCEDLALDAAVPEAAGHEDPVHSLEALPRGCVLGGVLLLHLWLQVCRIDPDNLQLAFCGEGCVVESLGDGEVRVLQAGVLAHECDAHLDGQRVHEVGEGVPLGEEGRIVALEIELGEEGVEDALLLDEQGHAVDVGDVVHPQALVRGHVAEVGQLLLGLAVQGARGAAHEEVGGDAQSAQGLHRVLRWLGLLFAHGSDHGDEAHVEEGAVLTPHLPLELADGLDEWHALDVTHSAAQLDDAYVGGVALAVCGRVCDALDPLLDGVGDVRHHLHRLAQEVALALFLQHVLVDLASRHVIVPPEVEVDEPLIVPEVEIRLTAIVKDEHLPMLEGRHGARVHVDVGVNLDGRHPVARSLDQHAHGRGCHALADARHDASRDDHVLGTARAVDL